MRNLLFTCCLCLSSLSSFGAIKLAMELEYGGKKISPGVRINSGETATISQDDLSIQIKTEERDQKIAVLSFKIFENKSGTETLLASPAVSTRFETSAEVTQGLKGKSGGLRLKVTPTLVP